MFIYCDDFPYHDRFKNKDEAFIPELNRTVYRAESGLGYLMYHAEDKNLSSEAIYSESPRDYLFYPRHVYIDKGGRRPLWPLLPSTYLYDTETGAYLFHIYWMGKHYGVYPCCGNVPEDAGDLFIRNENGKYVNGFCGVRVGTFKGEEQWRDDWKDYIINECMINTDRLNEWIKDGATSLF
ncbi:MAG: hypothetical protein IJS65_08680 [Clostridia bacterium]|nr:hypothetical protein [Clostridia bacterium]